MRRLKFASANSCNSKYWRNKEITFDELCERLKMPIRTTETAEEYPKLPKTERDKIKDKGGYVPALLRDGRRKRETVMCCSMVKLDGDKVKAGFIEDYEMLNTYASFLHTTHSHTPENPRVRIGIPLTRDVTPEELNAVTRYLAEMWGIDNFDECSYRPHQLMYWPSVPSNGEYVFKKFDGGWLNPDDILNAHPNWRDCSTLPTSSRESKVIAHEIKRQADPLGKDGLIGAFNSAYYPIQTLLDEELTDVYESAVNGRYSFITADSTAGGVVYDDKFFYSNHASDPAYGMLLNAFDLVRIHHYGDLTDKESVKAMLGFAQNDVRVKTYLAEERRKQAGLEFADVAEGDDWQLQLTYMPKSKVLDNSVWNLLLILNNDPDFAGFAYNEMAGRIQITGEVPWERPDAHKFWRDADTAQLKAIIDVRYTPFSTRNHDVCFAKVTDDRRFHPIRDYLDGLPPWDGIIRIDTQLIRLMQADDTTYVRAVTRKTHVAAVARIYHPGTKFDSMLVLDGNQGIGKSSYFKELVGEEYYCETLSLADMADKSGAEKIQDNWAVEISELAGIKKTDVEIVKSFLSTSDDKYRPSYGKVVESHPRQCVIIGTVNGERGYLRDITGNRRFWIVKVRQQEQSKKWKITPEERDQIWAEAKHYFAQGEKLYLDDDLIAPAQEAQREAMEQDERQGAVEEYLGMLLPANWGTLDTYERRNYFVDRNKEDNVTAIGVNQRLYVSNAEIWCECFGRPLADLKPMDSYALAALMTKIDGWERTKERKQTGIYGRQVVYARDSVASGNGISHGSTENPRNSYPAG